METVPKLPGRTTLANAKKDSVEKTAVLVNQLPFILHIVCSERFHIVCHIRFSFWRFYFVAFDSFIDPTSNEMCKQNLSMLVRLRKCFGRFFMSSVVIISMMKYLSSAKNPRISGFD